MSAVVRFRVIRQQSLDCIDVMLQLRTPAIRDSKIVPHFSRLRQSLNRPCANTVQTLKVFKKTPLFIAAFIHGITTQTVCVWVTFCKRPWSVRDQ
jgi:hypothetical protein